MSFGGTFAGMAGAALVGWVSAVVFSDFALWEAVAVEAAGFFGMWFDSFLGASVQYRAFCPTCLRGVEEASHPHPVERVRGLPFVGNDLVNLLATLAGAMAAVRLG